MNECVWIDRDAACCWLDLRDREAVVDMEPWIRREDETAAAAFGHANRRQSSILARALLRRLAGELLPGTPCTIGKTASGKPFLQNDSGRPVASASISHSRDIVAVALDRRRRIGIDVEYCRTGRDYARIAERIFPPAIAGSITSASVFYRAWCLYEAWYKAGDPDRLDPPGNGSLQRLLQDSLHDPGNGTRESGDSKFFVPAQGYAGFVVRGEWTNGHDNGQR